MAGNYADMPGILFAMDQDGTVGAIGHVGSYISAWMTVGQIQDQMREGSDWYYANRSTIFYFFPELRDVLGVFYYSNFSTTATIYSSTSDVHSATIAWTNRGTFAQTSGNGVLNYRGNVRTVAATGARAIAITGSGDTDRRASVIYGRLTNPVTDNPDRLRFWHPTLDQGIDDMTVNDVGELSDAMWFDWTESMRGTQADKQFRIKNNSASLTANDIIISASALRDGGIPNMMQFSVDGSTFAASGTIPVLGPGEVSPVITVRRVTTTGAPLGLWTGRYQASPNSWT